MGEGFLSWTEDLKKIHCKTRASTAEINEFILQHPQWAASIIRNAVGFEMYREFCLCCENFDRCYEKLGAIKRKPRLGCICNEFLNREHSEANKPRLRAYFKEVAVMLNI
jgi:hypothetical protein